MSIEITIPEAGESISEVQIGEWRKSEGDAVEQDEIIVELETDKASMELPAPGAGTLSKIVKQTGDTASIGDVIGRIESDGEAAAVRKKPEKSKKRERPEGEESAEAETEQEEPAARADEDAGEEAKGPPVEGEESPEREEQAEEAEAPDVPEEVEVRPRVMPSAERALAKHGLRPSDVRGTGPAGRILEEDVARYVERAEARRAEGERRARAEESEREEAEAAPPRRVERAAEDRQEEVVPMSRLRRSIARRLVEAQQTAALLTTFNEIDMSAVLDLRKRYGETFEKEFDVRLGLMSFFVKASIEALKRFPVVNAEVRGDEIAYRNYYDIGVAVATEHGLAVPIIRDADLLGFAEVERAIGDYASRARAKKLTPEELEGGTFTISNGGVYGSLLSTPIVNPPQSGILGLHAIQDRPVARNGEVVIRPMMYVALSYDHRIVDGEQAVGFLKHIKVCIEDPSRMLLDL
jgi:2-oxoglutarate dehydrogenase E2 component (dihydrolipoamide succinyltransferase)